MPTLAEDLLQLLLDDETGKRLVGNTELKFGLAGAVLLDLTAAGRVAQAGEDDAEKTGKFVVRDASPTGDDLLDRALGVLETKPLSGRRAVDKLAKGTKDEVLERLVRRGMVREEQSSVLGIFPRTQWPAVATEHERGLVEAISATLVGGAEPDVRTVNLIALLQAVDGVHKVVDPDAAGGKRELRKRAKALAESNIGGDAVQAAMDAVRAAVMIVIVSNVNAGGGAGS